MLLVMIPLSVLLLHQRSMNITRNYMSRVVRKPFFAYAKAKAQIAREADQRLCFCCTDSTIPLLPKFEISSLYSHLLWLYSPVCVGPGQNPRKPVFSQRGSYNQRWCCGRDIEISSKFSDYLESCNAMPSVIQII